MGRIMAGIIEDAQHTIAIRARKHLLRAPAAAAISALLLTAGCSGFFVYPGSTGNGGGTSSTGDYVYVANLATGSDTTKPTLAGFAVGTGSLSAVANSPFALPVSPTSVAINPANTLLYVAGGAAIYGYTIQSTGQLSVLNGGSPIVAATIQSMAISPDGQWLLALDQSSANTSLILDEYRINTSTGGLTSQGVNTFSVSGTVVPRDIKFSPNSKFVFAAIGTAGDLVIPFNAGAISTPSQLTEPTSQNSDNGVAVDPTSTYVYMARSGPNGGLAAYLINGGGLSPVTGSPFGASAQASESSVVVNKAGTAVYIANYTAGTISGYSIGSSGALTAISGSPYAAGSLVTALAVDNSGKYLLAAARNGSPDLALYTFDSSVAGKLNLSASVATGTDPADPVAMAPTN